MLYQEVGSNHIQATEVRADYRESLDHTENHLIISLTVALGFIGSSEDLGKSKANYHIEPIKFVFFVGFC